VQAASTAGSPSLSTAVRIVTICRLPSSRPVSLRLNHSDGERGWNRQTLTDSYTLPDVSSAVIQRLGVGLGVRVIKTAGDWVLLARDGVEVGYVKADYVVGIQ
jgi:hypothetical protein